MTYFLNCKKQRNPVCQSFGDPLLSKCTSKTGINMVSFFLGLCNFLKNVQKIPYKLCIWPISKIFPLFWGPSKNPKLATNA